MSVTEFSHNIWEKPRTAFEGDGDSIIPFVERLIVIFSPHTINLRMRRQTNRECI